MADSKIDKRLKNARIAYSRAVERQLDQYAIDKAQAELNTALMLKDANRAARTRPTL